MTMFNAFDDVNAILADLAEQGTLEPMAEPIDEPTCDPMDWAEVTGLADEMYPEPEMMVDENGVPWYVY
jgi:hypothetical protein